MLDAVFLVSFTDSLTFGDGVNSFGQAFAERSDDGGACRESRSRRREEGEDRQGSAKQAKGNHCAIIWGL